MRVDEDLGDALADVLKDAVPRVFVAKRVIALVAVHRPDLQWDFGEGESWSSQGSQNQKHIRILYYFEKFSIAIWFTKSKCVPLCRPIWSR